jgi:hypothetical protein
MTRLALSRLSRFTRADRGSVAATFSLSLIPMLAFAGVAIDYGRAMMVRDSMQKSADMAALSAAGSDSASVSRTIDAARADLEGNFATSLRGLAVQGKWLSPTDFQVVTQGAVPTTILQAVPGMPKELGVGVEAVARVYQPIVVATKPKVSQLDPEAADYNRISVYCFNPAKRSDPATKGRTKFVDIADNAGTKFNYTMPACQAGETVSYKLKNVRNARTSPSKWNDARVENYSYFTDTTLEGYTQKHNLGGVEILETVLCDSLAVCKPQSQGGVLPSGKNRTPRVEARECSPGKLMYFGWEDRPPGLGWTDRDYDDIRVIVECPSITKGQKQVRLIR